MLQRLQLLHLSLTRLLQPAQQENVSLLLLRRRLDAQQLQQRLQLAHLLLGAEMSP